MLQRGCKFGRAVGIQVSPLNKKGAVFDNSLPSLLWSQRCFVKITEAAEPEMVTIKKTRLEELLRAEMTHLASAPKPMMLKDILQTNEPNKLCDLIHKEVPKRYAMRLRMIQGLDGWDQVPELRDLHSMLTRWYQMLTLSSVVDLRHFTARIETVRLAEKQAVPHVATGLRMLRGGSHDDEFLDRWADGFLLSRIGSNTLLDQYRATVPKEFGGRFVRPTGIIEVNCNATAVIEKACVMARRLCKREHGRAPKYSVENYVFGSSGKQSADASTFSYIPGYLQYIVLELMKNCFNATLKNAVEGHPLNPVRIIVCCDAHRAAIRISDQGGGIPFDVGDRIWSYLYGAAADDTVKKATSLAGYGVGLPLSRLHALYLGGKLHITTYPGHGTDAHLLLPIIDADQVEQMPLGNW